MVFNIILDDLFYVFLDALYVTPNLILLQPKKVFVFESANQRAWQWKTTIEDTQQCQKNLY